ncbi:MAG: hypothetical protein AAGI23_08565 [Bacteroidota bacterium]
MATWTRQLQEREGDYFFSGQFLITAGVQSELSPEEVLIIYQNVQAFVREQNGIDYLQVFTDEEDRKLFFIDQLSKQMIESGDYTEEHNICTLMFAHEY